MADPRWGHDVIIPKDLSCGKLKTDKCTRAGKRERNLERCHLGASIKRI
jgi:hypothetical protein